MTTQPLFCMALSLASCASGDQSTFLTQSIQSLMQQTICKHGPHFSRTWADDLDLMEKNIMPIFDVVPEQNGKLRPQAVRYLAHRYLLETHGLQVNGLQPCAYCANASAPVWESVEVLKKGLSSTTQQALIPWKSRAIGLRDTAAIILALEHLVFEEGFLSKSFIQRAYKLNGLDWHLQIPMHKFAEVLKSHFSMVLLDGSSWIYTSQRGQKVWHRMQKANNVSLAQHEDDRKRVLRMFPDTWINLKALSRKAVSTLKKDRENQRFSFEDAFLVISKVAREFGPAQNQECANIKDALYSKDPSRSGSVPARSFYIAHEKLITETPEYLRSMGVLDESQPQLGPQVLLANYIASPTNCVITGSQYSICCIPECESILRHFESQIQGPTASPAQILAAAATVPSHTIRSRASLEPGSSVNEALEQVAAFHEGVVPLHGRLFSQWLHYVFPSECKYPYPSGAFNIFPLNRAEWYLRTGLNPDIDSKAPPVFPNVTASHELKKGKNLSQWTLVDEPYAGPLEKWEETTLPGTPLVTGIGATGITIGILFILYTTMFSHTKPQMVEPEPFLKI